MFIIIDNFVGNFYRALGRYILGNLAAEMICMIIDSSGSFHHVHQLVKPTLTKYKLGLKSSANQPNLVLS